MISRRTLLVGSVAGLAAPAVLSLGGATPAVAKAPLPTTQTQGVYRYKVGDFVLTALHDGSALRPLDEKFIPATPFADVQKALKDAFLPENALPIPFTTLAINTGSKLVLIDTGTGGKLAPTAGHMAANLQAAGLDPAAVDVIAISHFHPDHISGLTTKDDKPVFTQAEVHVPEAEWAFWMDDAALARAPEGMKGTFALVRKTLNALGDRVKRFAPGVDIVSGVASLPTPGHTPGHTAFVVGSGKDELLVLGDITNHPALFVRNPGWRVMFDMDGTQAEDTRRKILDRASADRTLVQGYHFPFPAVGHIRKLGDGYDYVPQQWRSAL